MASLEGKVIAGWKLQEAIKCILKNMPVGSIPIVYQYSTIT